MQTEHSQVRLVARIRYAMIGESSRMSHAKLVESSHEHETGISLIPEYIWYPERSTLAGQHVEATRL